MASLNVDCCLRYHAAALGRSAVAVSGDYVVSTQSRNVPYSSQVGMSPFGRRRIGWRLLFCLTLRVTS